ncbi:hypothetical protein FRC12_002399 [Ceratobasidium sp. 428]|nr:hypothetical protein FRC12_002399 [Ceratobasidium sp. 428]
MAGSSSTLRDAVTAVAALKRFDGKGQPCPEAEYRFYFVQATQGPAHLWLEALRKDAARKDLANKWSTLEAEIEKRWPTPPLDDEAQRRSYREDWAAHQFNMETMLPKLLNPTGATRPMQEWADEHKAFAVNVNSTDEDRVSKTLEEHFALAPWIIDLLPLKDRYGDKFDDHIKDIGELSPRSLITAYETYSLLESFCGMTVTQTPVPQTPSVQYQQSPATPRTPRGSTSALHRQTYSPQVRFASTVQVAQPQQQPSVPIETRPVPHTPHNRDQPPHMPQTPITPAGPVESVVSRIARADQQPRNATLIPDTPDQRAHWSAETDRWKLTHGTKWPSLQRPYPLTPGTYEPTANLCTKCGKGYHYFLDCTAQGSDVLGEREREYRKIVSRRLRDDQRAGAQLTTPTPRARFRDTSQVELSEPEDDAEEDRYEQGNE